MDYIFYKHPKEELSESDEALLRGFRYSTGKLPLGQSETDANYHRALSDICERRFWLDTIMHAIKNTIKRYRYYHKSDAPYNVTIDIFNKEYDTHAYCTNWIDLPYAVYPYLPYTLVTNLITRVKQDSTTGSIEIYILATIVYPKSESDETS